MAGWLDLRSRGKSKALNSSFIWMIAVPIVAKVTSEVQSITFTLGNKPHEIHLELPFSWKCLYFASLAFTFASLIFAIQCPFLISKYRNFQDYLDSGGGASELGEIVSRIWEESFSGGKNLRLGPSNETVDWWLVQVFEKAIRSSTNKTATAWIEREGHRIVGEPNPEGKGVVWAITYPVAAENLWRLDREQLRDVFYVAATMADRLRRGWRIAASTFYNIGFLLLGIVSAQNCWYVLKNVIA